MRILKVEQSPMKNKRFRVFLDSGKHYDFGLDTGSTFIDHGDNKKRNAYIARHFGNRVEKQLIENLVPSPALFSMFLLWGKYDSLEKNIDYLNDVFEKFK
jgi:hypothetical protein